MTDRMNEWINEENERMKEWRTLLPLLPFLHLHHFLLLLHLHFHSHVHLHWFGFVWHWFGFVRHWFGFVWHWFGFVWHWFGSVWHNFLSSLFSLLFSFLSLSSLLSLLYTLSLLLSSLFSSSSLSLSSATDVIDQWSRANQGKHICPTDNCTWLDWSHPLHWRTQCSDDFVSGCCRRCSCQSATMSMTPLKDMTDVWPPSFFTMKPTWDWIAKKWWRALSKTT